MERHPVRRLVRHRSEPLPAPCSLLQQPVHQPRHQRPIRLAARTAPERPPVEAPGRDHRAARSCVLGQRDHRARRAAPRQARRQRDRRRAVGRELHKGGSGRERVPGHSRERARERRWAGWLHVPIAVEASRAGPEEHGSLGAETAERRRVTGLDDERRASHRSGHIPRRPALERRPLAPAVSAGLGFDECAHGHAGHVLERAREEPRLPVRRRGQQHDGRRGAHLEHEQAGVVAGLLIPHPLQPHFHR